MQIQRNISSQVLYDSYPQAGKSRCISSFPINSRIKQKKIASGIEDNRELLAEQFDLLDIMREAGDARQVADGVIQGRIPNYAALNSLKKTGLTVAEIKEKVGILLMNLKADGRIPATEDIDVNRLIGDDGGVNSGEYNRLFGQIGKESNEDVYHDPLKAHSKLNLDDTGSFRGVLINAHNIVQLVLANEAFVTCVFGGKKDQALINYREINKQLEYVFQNIDRMVTTDYNGDDETLGVGGYANFYAKTVHFLKAMCGISPLSSITVIHECAHLSNKAIVDKGYNGTPGFENMSEEDKLTNAAHYEIVPYWIMGLPCKYPPNTVFTPNNSEGPNVDNVGSAKKEVCDYFQRSHNVAFNNAGWIRMGYIGKINMTDNIIEYSINMGLTIHLHKKPTITLLDLTLAQDIAHSVKAMYDAMKNDNEIISKYKDFDQSLYRAYFIHKIISNNPRAGITSARLQYLNSLYKE